MFLLVSSIPQQHNLALGMSSVELDSPVTETILNPIQNTLTFILNAHL